MIYKIVKYFSSNPLYLSSVLTNIIIPLNLYKGNYKLLYTEIPLGITSILYHHKFSNKIRYLDIFLAYVALIHHSQQSYKNRKQLSLFLFTLCVPSLFFTSKYLEEKNINKSNLMHALMHYTLIVASSML
tara:strand:+ start:1169 stop:1558 length:390 start_codon:yes stop_codon:yes gene_type:complete